MKYKPRDGIVLTKICGVKLLIPTRKAAEFCPSIVKLSFIKSAVWEMIAHDRPIDDIYKLVQTFSKKDMDVVKERVDRLITDLYEHGYLVEDTGNAEDS